MPIAFVLGLLFDPPKSEHGDQCLRRDEPIANPTAWPTHGMVTRDIVTAVQAAA
jgi:hypothetical protein